MRHPAAIACSDVCHHLNADGCPSTSRSVSVPAPVLHSADHDQGDPADIRRFRGRLGHRHAVLSGNASHGLFVLLRAHSLPQQESPERQPTWFLLLLSLFLRFRLNPVSNSRRKSRHCRYCSSCSYRWDAATSCFILHHARCLQSWFRNVPYAGVLPYRLFAFSNAGSIMAHWLAYPFLIEPLLLASAQLRCIWSVAYAAVGC